MRKFLAPFIVLVACGDSTTAPDSTPSVEPPPISASATHSTTNVRIPVLQTFFIPCVNGGTGELVDVAATLHLLIRMTESSSGNLSITFHANPQGPTGTGQTTGITYHAGGVTQETGTLRADGLPFEFTFVDRAVFTTNGFGTFVFRQTVHVTINNNGDVTADVLNSSAECL